MIEENVYPNLVKVFYSNMDTSEEKKTRVITNVGGVLIDFDVSELNSILRTSNYGLKFHQGNLPKLIIMLMLTPLEIYAGVMIFLTKIVTSIFALNAFVSKLIFYFVLFI